VIAIGDMSGGTIGAGEITTVGGGEQTTIGVTIAGMTNEGIDGGKSPRHRSEKTWESRLSGSFFC
jgi:hypothetical protein